jgi:hypothetical protein
MIFLILREAKSDKREIISTCTKTVTEMLMFGSSVPFYLNSYFCKDIPLNQTTMQIQQCIFKKKKIFVSMLYHLIVPFPAFIITINSYLTL